MIMDILKYMYDYCSYHLFYSWAYRLEYCMFMG